MLSIVTGNQSPHNEMSFQIKPFLRWAGGKQNLVKQLTSKLPKSFSGRYHEPFLGAGSLFFFNNFNESFLSDINSVLISTYKCLKISPEEVSDRLEKHRKRISNEYYYKIRNRFNKYRNEESFDQAADFIFLNHTSFNGIFRVNQKGEYNVPFGKLKAAIPDLAHLKAINKKLQTSEIKCSSYDKIISKAVTGDFVYLDPPYPPLNVTSFFQHYTINKFPEIEQIRLAEYANELSKKGILVMISNAEVHLIKELYKDWNLNSVKTYRYINNNSLQNQVNELIITNY